MNRRNFVGLAGMGMLADVAAARVEAATQGNRGRPAGRKALMKVGHQHDHSAESLTLMAGLGVNHICSGLPSARFDDNWTVEGLTKFRERVEGFGIRLEMMPLPLSSAYITRAEYPNIMLGKSPDRDRELDDICQIIRNAARAGVPALKYNMSILGVVSTEPLKCRGDAMCRAFSYEKAGQEPPLTEAGPVNADVYWERITYFLKRVMPVAEEYKVRLACHPHDPGMPPDKGFRGVHTVLGSVAGLKRFLDIMPGKYHGLNFCQGTVSEMLARPGEEIYDVIRYFGSRGKIFNVHFRNIRGGFLNFMETFIDDGDVDMLRAMRVYKEVGYDGMMMPDHVPKITGDARGLHAFAYTFGYIKALIAAVSAES
jgi:mannonate dehydratase